MDAPLLPRWSTSFAVSGPLSGGSALGLDGSTGYAESTVGENGGSTGLQTFSMGVWFKSSVTSAGNGRGSLLGVRECPGRFGRFGVGPDPVDGRRRATWCSR